MMTQKEAVFKAVTNTCEASDTGVFSPSKEERATINAILAEGFTQGQISYDGEVPTGSDLKSYVSGLQSNWLRKDKRLNGNVQYVAKNPGSRAGSGDAQIKAMRALLAAQTDESKKAEIQAFIDARLSAIKPSKSVTINKSDLPEELQHFVS